MVNPSYFVAQFNFKSTVFGCTIFMVNSPYFIAQFYGKSTIFGCTLFMVNPPCFVAQYWKFFKKMFCLTKSVKWLIYDLDYWGYGKPGFDFQTAVRDTSLHNIVQTSYIGDPTSYQMRIEATWAKSLPLTSIKSCI